MPLLADTPADRAEQMLALTERLTILLDAETQLIQAHQPPLAGAEGEEKARLANLYRQEMARIAADRDLIRAAPAAAVARLRTATTKFRAALATHERALTGVKEISEGLVKAIAEEVQKVRAGPAAYGASGGYSTQRDAGALALNKTA
jgi:uncharacterized phage protein gp47/JayE